MTQHTNSNVPMFFVARIRTTTDVPVHQVPMMTAKSQSWDAICKLIQEDAEALGVPWSKVRWVRNSPKAWPSIHSVDGVWQWELRSYQDATNDECRAWLDTTPHEDVRHQMPLVMPVATPAPCCYGRFGFKRIK